MILEPQVANIPVTNADIQFQDRFLLWKAKRRSFELRVAETEEQRLFVARMISGTLDPRVLDGRSEFSKLGLISRSATQFSELLQALEGVAVVDSGPGARTNVPIAVTDAMSRLRGLASRFGGFAVWLKRPKWALCDRVLEALINRDCDGEDYLQWFVTQELRGNRSLEPYVASVLWGPTCQKWREWDECSIYGRITGAARKRKYWDERDAKWLAPQPNTIPLSHLERLPDVVDPLEFLFSSRARIKLVTLKEMVEARVLGSPVAAGLNLTHEQLQYFTLKKVEGLKQVEVRQRLGWDEATLQRVKRATDRKLKQASSSRWI